MTKYQLPVRGVGRIPQPQRSYPTPLPPGTMVQRPTDGNVGVVRRYHPDAVAARMGTFPVEWHDGQWETCGPADVIPVINAVS